MAKKILVIAAHPDDEVLGCGGTIAKHSSIGDEVQIMFLSDGVFARDEADESCLKTRQVAAKKASKILGANTPIFFSFPDNRLDTVPLLDVVLKIEEIKKKFNPDFIYTHYDKDLNIDHRITAKAVFTAFRPQPNETFEAIYMFEVASSSEWASEIFKPIITNNIEDEIEAKIEALEAYYEEMRAYPHARSIENIKAQAIFRGCSVGYGYGEAFLPKIIRYV